MSGDQQFSGPIMLPGCVEARYPSKKNALGPLQPGARPLLILATLERSHVSGAQLEPFSIGPTVAKRTARLTSTIPCKTSMNLHKELSLSVRVDRS
jgi:hypothetical protein